MQVLKIAWVVGAVCKVHYEAVRSLEKDGGESARSFHKKTRSPVRPGHL